MTAPKKQGTVYNNYSNLVIGLAVDAGAARAWGGYDHPGYEELTNAVFEGEESRVELEGGTGLLFEIGGCGTSDVFQLREDDVALLEHYSDDWNPEIEREFLAVVASPLGEEAEQIGKVEVKSGVLALLHAGDPAASVADAKQPATGESAEVEGGLLLGVPNGTYVLFKETLEAKGGWGTIESRIRVVRESAVESARAAVESATPAAATSVARRGGDARRFALPEGMAFVECLTLSNDGEWLLAGEKSGPNVAAFRTATGELAWSRALAERADSNQYTQHPMLSIHGDRLAAAVRAELFVLSLSDGSVLAKHDLGPGDTPFARMISSSSSFARFTPDGEHLLVGQLPRVRVLQWKTGAERAVIEKCSATCDALFTPDGSLLVLPGYELQLCDAATFTVAHRVDVAGYASSAAISPDGARLAVGTEGTVKIFRIPSLEPEPGELPNASSVQTVSVQEISWAPDGKRLATATEDGYVRLWDLAACTIVTEWSGHDTTIPGTGARNLHGLAFSPDGKTLYVGGAPKGTHAITAYSVP